MALENVTEKPIINLDLPDDFEYRNPKLMDLIKQAYLEKTKQ